MAQAMSSGDSFFELGKLYCDRGDFEVSISKLNQAAECFYKEKSFDKYLKCQNFLLRMYSEREDNEKINLTKEKLQDLVLKEGFELSSKTYYTLGVSATLKDQFDVALEYFQKSLAIALASDDKEDMCYAINGIAIVYFRMNRLSDALKEIYNLQVFFQVLPLTDLKLSTQIVNGLILRNMERYDQALEIFWECHETLKFAKNMYMYFHLLYAIGSTYQKAGDNDLARVYLQLAKRSIDSSNLKQLAALIDKRLEELGVRPNDDYDLIFDPSNNSVVERKKGRIDFKNQFILLDLLHLFLKTPGQIYSKEILVKKVWSQDYNPAVHDNKIYVTIKRLRQLIEPDYEKPKYIFRSKNGYYLNKGTKVLLEQ
jgi:tetratricopeptide (TPR) repeat protein